MYLPTTTFEISKNIVFRKWEEDGHFVLIELQGDHLFELHDISAMIWEQIAENKSYQDILSVLEETYEPFGNEEVNEVNQFITQLVEKEILKVSL